MNILVGMLFFFLGGLIGLVTMCLVQVGAQADRKVINDEDGRIKNDPSL